MFDYNTFRRDCLSSIMNIGRQVTRGTAQHMLKTKEQIDRIRGDNFMTPEVWSYRVLDGGRYVVEISYGFFIDHGIVGVTVFHTDPAEAELDHDKSRAVYSASELEAYLRELNPVNVAA